MTWWLLQNVVATALLALAVALVCRTVRLGPVARHALWVIVLVKFVTPPLVVWPWAVPVDTRVERDLGAQSTEGGGQWATDAAPGDGPLTGGSRADRGDELASVLQSGGVPGSDEGVDVIGALVSRTVSVWPWIVGFWITGSLAVLTIEMTRLVRLARRVRGGVPADGPLLTRANALAARLGVRPVDVRIVPGASPPAVWSLGRPQILWPADLAADASDISIDGLLLHELAHIRRRDHLVGWIELVVGVIWWWNPLFWFVRASLREQAELACDAWVISALPDGRRAYAESLLTLSGATPARLSMAVVGVRASNRRVLERRLVMIMQGRAPLRLTRIGVVALGFFAAGVMPGWAASQNPPPPPPPVPVPVEQAPPRALPPVPASGVPVMPVPPPAMVAPTPMVPMVVTPLPGQMPTPMAIPVLPVEAPPGVTYADEPQRTPQPPRSVAVAPTPRGDMQIYVRRTANLPDEGQALVKAYEDDRAQMQREFEQRMTARHDDAIAALEALQDRYTKAGQLDEAVAIRDYLRAGGPGVNMRYSLGGRGFGGGRGVAPPATTGAGRGRGGVSATTTGTGRGGRGGGRGGGR